MCDEEGIKQDSGALGDLAACMRGVDSGLLVCKPRMNESTTLAQTQSSSWDKHRNRATLF